MTTREVTIKTAARLWTSLVRLRWLGAALAASGILLGVSPGAPGTVSRGPVPVAVAWARAQHGVTPANLPDGTSYQPVIFLDARTSVGTAATRDGKSLRLLLIGSKGQTRQLRRVPFTQHPSFQTFIVADNVLVWAEGARGKIQIWRANLRDRRAPRQLTADAGAATFYDSQYDLVVNGGRVYWVATPSYGTTEVRSIALAGGPVDARTVPGTWTLSAWPWLVNGITASSGTTLLKNLITDRDLPVSGAGSRSTTQCSPTWCQVASLSDDGGNQIDLMRPDGSGRLHIAGDTARTVIADVAPLDRYEIYSKTGPDSDLTGNVQLLIFEIVTHRTVEVSPDAGRVSYRNGLLVWATGNLDTFIWHALDLRTI